MAGVGLRPLRLAAAASTATSARSRRPRTTGRSCRSPPTAPASSPARRSSASYAAMFGLTAAPSGSATSSARARPTASASTSCAGCSPTRPGCAILGDGRQSKSYIHVEDVIDAVLLAAAQATDAVRRFNVATGDYITVTEIAELAVRGP